MYNAIGCLNRRFSSSRSACFSVSVIPRIASKNRGSLATCAPFFNSSTCSSRWFVRAKSRTSRRSCSGVRWERGFSMLSIARLSQHDHPCSGAWTYRASIFRFKSTRDKPSSAERVACTKKCQPYCATYKKELALMFCTYVDPCSQAKGLFMLVHNGNGLQTWNEIYSSL